jgi:zinc/manganese transport system permease protein
VTVWVAIAASYETNYPVGFFVGGFSALWYTLGRGWVAWRRGGRRIATDAQTGVHAPERHTILT